ncbi:MAG: D-isomer specific 2-hydroxyacid dehydrogenase family protein [Acidimicrobiia bacterium]
MNSRTRSQPIAVAPEDHPWYQDICDAVERGHGTVSTVKDAAGLIWLAKFEQDLGPVLHPKLQWVQVRAASVDNWIDSGILTSDRTFTSARGIYGEAAAEHVLALLFSAARRLHVCARLDHWDPDEGRGQELRGSTVVIVGAGGVGGQTASYLKPFGVRVLAVTRTGRIIPDADSSLASAQLDDVWPQADYVVLTVPLTRETKHIVGPKELAAMPDHAWLINISRGSLVDTDALVTALRAGTIGGAALDVTDPEPLPEGHPLWQLPNVLITPHVANPKANQRAKLIERVEENVRRFVQGEPLLGAIDASVGY